MQLFERRKSLRHANGIVCYVEDETKLDKDEYQIWERVLVGFPNEIIEDLACVDDKKQLMQCLPKKK